MSHIVAPSLLACDFSILGAEIDLLNQSECDWIHFDVMDGNFVPNISFGLPILVAVKQVATKPVDVHLMIEQPERYIFAFKDAGADRITVHYEVCRHLHRVIQQIKDSGGKAGVAINPHTPVTVLEDVLHMVDQVNVMSVNPGFGGQQFIPHTFNKIRDLKEMIITRGLPVLIQVDGGVNVRNASELIEAGADILVSGNSVFKSKSPQDTIKMLKNVNAT